MSSVVDICNLALSRLGDSATVSSIDPPEGSAQAGRCAVFYPLARDVAQEAHNFNFTITRAAPAQLASPVPGWQYAYAKPNDCLKIVKVIPPETADWELAAPIPYAIETEDLTGVEIIVTDQVEAVVVYQRRVYDTQRFPPKFVSALAWLLASYLAGPIVKGEAGRKASVSCYNAYTTELASAAALDANQNKKRRRHVPDSMRARGYAGGNPVVDAPVEGPFGFYAYPDAI